MLPLKELPVVEGKAIPWFGKDGMGTQFLTGEGVDGLIKNGYIKKVN
ncbi:glycohydrolase toxin TNT-related protein [uncultured Apibacter sp.]